MAHPARSHATVRDWSARETIPFSVDSPEAFDAAVDKMIASLGDPLELLGFGEALHGGGDLLILMMADNLASMLSRERGRGKVLAFGHSAHLQRERSRLSFGADVWAWWPAGAHLRQRHRPARGRHPRGAPGRRAGASAVHPDAPGTGAPGCGDRVRADALGQCEEPDLLPAHPGKPRRFRLAGRPGFSDVQPRRPAAAAAGRQTRAVRSSPSRPAQRSAEFPWRSRSGNLWSHSWHNMLEQLRQDYPDRRKKG